MRRAFLSFSLGAWLALGVASAAPDRSFSNHATDATLIELFSSEGCSSCPPAETWVGRLKDSPRLWKQVFPVAFHVDYWDGLGWPDRFARPAYTDRQRHYATALGQDSVYTPEFVVSGREWRGWFHDESLPVASGTSGTLSLALQAGTVAADFIPAPGRPADYTLHLAWLGMGIVSNVKAGENGGQALTHDFIVLGLQAQELKPAAGGHFLGAPLSSILSGPDQPAALVAWVSSPEKEVVQVAGGSLR